LFILVLCGQFAAWLIFDILRRSVSAVAPCLNPQNLRLDLPQFLHHASDWNRAGQAEGIMQNLVDGIQFPVDGDMTWRHSGHPLKAKSIESVSDHGNCLALTPTPTLPATIIATVFSIV